MYGMMIFWDCEWKCSTTHHATNEKRDRSGVSGDKSTEPRGVAAPRAGGQLCNGACNPHTNVPESYGPILSAVSPSTYITAEKLCGT